MTRERLNELWPVMKAYKDGKEIEFLNDNVDNWTSVTEPQWHDSTMYRVKPKPEYVPFTYDDWEMFAGKFVICKFIEGEKDEKNGYQISSFNTNRVAFSTSIINSGIYYSALLEFYTFMDGTPCGKLINK